MQARNARTFEGPPWLGMTGDNDQGGKGMYIGGGVLTLVIIILLLVWLF